MTKMLLVLTLAAGFSAASPAAAARLGAVPFRATIATADLDLSRADGQAALLARAEKAADRICGSVDSVTRDGGATRDLCRARFIDAARSRIDAPASQS